MPHGDRSGAVIEPWLTDQWYVDAETLAKPAIEAVETGRIRFVPAALGEHLFRVDAQHPALVHLAPALVGPSHPGLVRARRQGLRRRHRGRGGKQAAQHYGGPEPLTRDEDVLDTWFSSAPVAVLDPGLARAHRALETYYPNSDVLITGFDIIFFWVARMVMLGMHFMGDVPFRTVYIHALVRDEKGQKMSKSKGNVIDPLALIDKYGADALRFTLAAMEAQGRDIKLAESRVAGYRNFATKLWNAARFCEANGCKPVAGFDPGGCEERVNRWIVGEAARAAREVTQALDAYRFDAAAGAVYHFTWDVFCDWYLEFSKPTLSGPDGPAKDETRATAAWVLDHDPGPAASLHAVRHRGALGPHRRGTGGHADHRQPGPRSHDGTGDADAAQEMDWVVRLVTAVRAVRAEMNVPAGARIALGLRGAAAGDGGALDRHREVIARLARLREPRPRMARCRRRAPCR